MTRVVSIFESVETVGYDSHDWIKKVVLPRIQRDEDNTRYIFPDPLPDLINFSRAHSWYKHLHYAPGTFFPMLRIGTEPTGPIDITTANRPPQTRQEEALHWAFISEDSLFMNEELYAGGYHITKQPWSVMHDCSFHFSDDFSEFSLAEDTNNNSRFYAQIVLLKCNIICDRITRILLKIDPSPPIAPFLIHDAARSRCKAEEETLEVLQGDMALTIVAKRKYPLHFSIDISWDRQTRTANSNFFKL